MLQSLTDFNIYVNSRSGGPADKFEIRAEGAALARAAVREAVDHAKKHLSAALVDNPTDIAMAAHISMIRSYLNSARLTDG